MVNSDEAGSVSITLDDPIRLESQSGSPIISHMTGKVIGILASSRGKITGVISLTPAHAIAKALEEDQAFPLLQDVVPAKRSPASKKKAPPKDSSAKVGPK
jgi:hypothetical protein